MHTGRVAVTGADSHGTLPYRTTAALAERLGAAVVEFPGDHVGYLRQPAEFAEAGSKALETTTGTAG